MYRCRGKKDLGSSGTASSPLDAPITHGMCGDCARQALSFKATQLRDFLNRFACPVFLVTNDGKIVTGNIAGLSLVHKNPDKVDGECGEKVFECKYADLPGGCGHTVHCKTCTIRNTVMETLRSGFSNTRIPAYPDLHHMTGELRVRFLITTERIGEAVLLRIDDVLEERRVLEPP